MKSFSAIPRLSLFTIWISLVVGLAGFIEAEVISKESETKQAGDDALKALSPFKGNIPYFQTNLKVRDDGLTSSKSLVDYAKNFQLGSSHSFEEPDDFNSEKEIDGYGYDDDEYYHFNCKRNNDASENSNGAKLNKDNSEEMLQKERKNDPNYLGSKVQKDDQKETEIIEMLNFKETHSNPTEDSDQTSDTVAKPFSHENAHKKPLSNPGTMDTIKMSDLKQNSAIEEKMKDRKEESTGLLGSVSSNKKLMESKTPVKASEEKESMKLKDVKITKDAKDKEANLKEEKSNMVGKSLKENVKHTEEKDKLDHDVKNVKLSDGSKYEDKVTKFVETKDPETAKLTKEGKDDSKFIDKVMSHMENSNRISQIKRANFAESNFKDDINNMKQAAAEEDEKNLEEFKKNEKNVGLNEYTASLRDGKENLGNDDAKNYEFSNKREDNWELAKNVGKITEYLAIPIDLEAKSDRRDYYNKRDSWKEHSKMQHDQQRHEQQHEQPYDQTVKGPYHFNFPSNELDNTEYHKNYLKYLKRYKNLDENPKVLTSEPQGSVSTEEKNLKEKSGKKKKRSKQKDKRSMENGVKDISANSHFGARNKDICEKEPESSSKDSQTLSRLRSRKENLQRSTKYISPQNVYRKRRKSPQKFEYEIKIINQNQAEGKNGLSVSFDKRKKKNVKSKLLDQNEDKNMKKCTYSQVSKDYLTNHNRIQLGEKKLIRRDPIWSQKKREDRTERNKVKTRAVPSGYYSNRVKFGQKHFSRNDEDQTGEPSPTYVVSRAQSTDNIQVPSSFQATDPSASYRSFYMPRSFNIDESYEVNRLFFPYGNFWTPSNDKNILQQPWNKEHDPMKRYDSGLINKQRASNSLLLVKKDRNGDRIAKTFVDANKGSSEDDLDSDQLAKMLSKDSEYVVLKKTEKNKFQKISDSDSVGNKINSESSPFPSKKFDLFENGKPEIMKSTSKQSEIKSSDLSTVSYHSDENKKYSAKFHGPVAKANLKKSVDKFKNLACLFRDSEQESPANLHSTLEIKDGSEIVFSEDKLPDPIVINNDVNGKSNSLKTKSQNSISSISTNFKTLDQDGKSDSTKDSDSAKNLLISEVKTENSETSWEPALKNLFPEAKTINSMHKNGNEIIILDFERNQLKQDNKNYQNLFKNNLPNKQTAGARSDSVGLLKIPDDRQVFFSDSSPIFLQPNLKKPLFQDKKYQTDKGNQLIISGQDGNALILSPDSSASQETVNLPNNQVIQFPQYLKTFSDKKSVNLNDIIKAITKKRANLIPSHSNDQFMEDLLQLSEMNHGARKEKVKILNKRHTPSESTMSSSSLPELSTYSNAKVKYIGNLLRNLMANENLELKGNKDVAYVGSSSASKNMENEFKKSNAWDAMKLGSGFSLNSQSQWTLNNDKQKHYPEPKEEEGEYVTDELKKEMKGLLESEGMKGAEENDYQSELWEKIAEASDRIQRLRREGIGNRKLRKAIEDVLNSKERRQSEKNENADLLPEVNIKDESNKKVSVDSNVAETKNKKSNENMESSNLNGLKEAKSDVLPGFREEGAKKCSEGGNIMTPDAGAEFDESLDSNKNQKTDHLINSLENDTKRKKRHLNRETRFASFFGQRVSSNEVENKILQNLVEDNDESVSFSGIKRKLLSSKEDLEATDDYFKQTTCQNSYACTKNFSDIYVNPVIQKIFESDDLVDQKNRARRSLTSGFHSNYKREIDLDESMPNDFQNFLVTSLGGFGSQKREVVKKDEALWEGKEGSQDNYNQITENAVGNKDTIEDSALKKREVSNKENRKRENVRKVSSYEEDENVSENTDLRDVVKAMKHTSKKIRSQGKSEVHGTSKELDEEKVPTHIRIQITKASTKEKKSSKPAGEEGETTSNEMEKMPTKENEFFEKNHLSSVHISPQRVVNQIPKSKYLQSPDFGEVESDDNSGRQKVYVALHPYRGGKRKKKKYVQENPMKPVKDFLSLDQKAKESLVRKYFSDQNTQNSGTTQKIPVSNHLPQVETVYNPTQGTTKAQLENHRLNKLNPLTPKNAASVKNSLQSNEVSGLDEDILRSYLKEKPIKAKQDKVIPKEFEEVDWKPYSGKMRDSQGSGRDNQLEEINNRNYKNLYTWPYNGIHSGISHTPRLMNSFSRLNLYQPPYSSYLYQSPTLNSMSTDSAYDNSKFKQNNQNWDRLNREWLTSKSWRKPYIPENVFYKADSKEKASNAFSSSMSDAPTNTYDYFLSKKPLIQKYKSKDYIGLGLKNPMNSRNKLFYGPNKYINYLKTIDDDKQAAIETSRPQILDSTKELDYLDTSDDKDYVDDDTAKQDPRLDDPAVASAVKKLNKAYETSARNHLYNYKNSEIEDAQGEEYEDVDEDYDDNIEDDDMNDYSYLARTNTENPGYLRKNPEYLHESEKFHAGDIFHSIYPKTNQFELRGTSFEQAEYKKGKMDEKFEPGKQKLTLTDITNDLDPFSGTLNALKKANENTNIFGKNLMKNLNRYNYDDNWKDTDKTQQDKSYKLFRDSDYLTKISGSKRKLERQHKLKRSQKLPQIGSRIFYAAKSEMSDTGTAGNNGVGSLLQSKDRKTRNSYYNLPKRNPLKAEFRGSENECEYESEENGNHFSGNLINNEKPDLKEEINTNSESETGNARKRNSDEDESSNNIEEVKENFEDDGETIADDNILENIIGKYIVRKSVTLSPISKLKKLDTENYNPDLTSKDPKMHKARKRSLNDRIYKENFPGIKILRKRLSSGHLTENNYRKYHKKNFNKKRQMTETKTDICDTVGSTQETSWGKSDLSKRSNLMADNKRHLNQNKKAKKRYALDIFRKITSKDKDAKKAETADSRNAGFEPLLSSSDKKYEDSDFRSIMLPFERKITENNDHRESSFLKDMDKENLGESKKEKSKEYLKPKADEPWKIELNQKYDMTLAEDSSKMNGKTAKGKFGYSPKEESQDLKAYLVIQRNMKTSKRNSNGAGTLPRSSETSQTEVGNSYPHVSVKGAGPMEKCTWKRSLKSSDEWLKGSEEDAEGAQVPKTEKHLSTEDTNRALQDSEGSSEGASQLPAPHVVQRNTENAGFVNIEAGNKNFDKDFPSSGRSFNGKSVFPPPNDANIIGDSRHLNEETSKYLGQQIVEAIFAHVGSNPRFKKLIAPGLGPRTSRYQEDMEDKRRALNEGEFSEQVQNILQRVMYEIEKLAEKRVKRRMCNKLDQNSRQFLQSLLDGSAQKNKDGKNFFADEDFCPILNSCSDLEEAKKTYPSSVPPSSSWAVPSTAPSVASIPIDLSLTSATLGGSSTPFYQEEVSANLKRKQLLLQKLVSDYQHLSQLEKQNLDVNYRYLLYELDETNRALASINHKNCAITDFSRDLGAKNYSYEDTNSEKNKIDPQADQRLEPKNPLRCDSNFTTVWRSYHMTTKSPLFSMHAFEQSEKQLIKEENFITVPRTEPTPSPFLQMESSESPMMKPNSTSEPFEDVAKINFADIPKKADNMSVLEISREPVEFDYSKSESSLPTPEIFDLLPSQPTLNSSTPALPTQGISENVRIKQSLPKEVYFKSPNVSADYLSILRKIPHSSISAFKPTELHKLGAGDAAGLQLALKYHGPWMSNLNFSQSLDVYKPHTFPSPQKLHRSDTAMEEVFERNSASSSSLTDSNFNQYSNIQKPFTFYKKSVFPFGMDTKFFTPKINPFQRFRENRKEEIKQILPMQYFLRKYSVPEMLRQRKSQRKNMNLKEGNKNIFKKSSARNKRHLSHSVPRRSRWWKRQSPTASGKPENDDYDLDENPSLEYLIWSSMPTVRRRLNDLEMDLDFPGIGHQAMGPKGAFFDRKSKRKKKMGYS